MTAKIFSSCIILLTISCSQNKDPETLFTLLSGKITNVTFKNLLKETEEFNVLDYGYFYNGGGVAVGDINNDGLPDIYFTGNLVASHLYLNKGNWEFEEIAEKAEVAAAGLWNTGVTMADVNGDGYLDIYVCRSAAANTMRRKNLLYINNGDLTFTEKAETFGLADPGYSTQAAFFDYDRDGDLDMYLLNHSIQEYAGFNNLTPQWKEKQHRDYGDKLFRNDTIFFTDQTWSAGIKTNVLGFGLGLGISDVNSDGWPDMYVSNDYNEEDYLYINNKDGTFSDQLPEFMAHVSLSSMGSDIADFNNDGYFDIMTLDMLPEGNYRQKLMSGPDNYDKYQRLISSGFYYQSIRNMLHLNNQGLGFSEIGQLAGVSSTDWSWASLFADFDNDGYKDLFITNGYGRDYTNMDFLSFMVSETLRQNAGGESLTTMETLEKMPAILVPNYIYHNQADLTFKNKTEAWGLDQPSISNGAAYADLDNDGDLDLIVNNINETAFIYRNNSRQLNQNNYLKVMLNGDGMNTKGIGAKVALYCGEDQYTQEVMPSRGFQSAVEHVLLFGLGDNSKVDRIEILWPNGQIQELPSLDANQTITIDQQKASNIESDSNETVQPALFTEVEADIFTHQENPYIDFKQQQLLPHKLSTMGPRITVTDINGNGREDIYIGGAKGVPGQLLQQSKAGNFKKIWESEKEFEDIGVLFFDADQDGDQDLYVVSGGADFQPEDPGLQDRLYMNKGNGEFYFEVSALPAMRTSGSSVAASDYDGDGDLDLFVGGRLVPGSYPTSPRSYLLENDGKGNFHDVTEQVNSELLYPGMVTDVIWSDFNGDELPDLILAGEWMPVRIFQNADGKLMDVTDVAGTAALTGWWNRILQADLDDDGDFDYVLGNFGWNSQIKASHDEPVSLYSKDFDNNGQLDPILCYFLDGESYPAFSKDDLENQIPLIKKKYQNYSDYADKKITDIFSAEELETAMVLKATELSTGYLENLGDGRFSFHSFPKEAQFSPTYGLFIDDVNGDGFKDVILGGNFFGTRVKFGRYDANLGTVLKGNGQGGFEVLHSDRTGLMVKGEVRDIVKVKSDGDERLLLWTRNNNGVLVYRVN